MIYRGRGFCLPSCLYITETILIDRLQLGSLFSKQDSYGFGMVMPVAMGGQKKKMVVSAIAMRIKQRLLFLYLCAEYKNEETIKWIRKVSEDCADAILNANK